MLCRIYQKSGAGPKNGEQYGAPVEEEEEQEEEDCETLPTTGDDDFGVFRAYLGTGSGCEEASQHTERLQCNSKTDIMSALKDGKREIVVQSLNKEHLNADQVKVCTSLLEL